MSLDEFTRSVFIQSHSSETATTQRHKVAKSRARALAVATIVTSVALSAALIYFQVGAHFFYWSQRYDAWRLDELGSVFGVAVCAMGVWFAHLWRQAAREVAARIEAEHKLRTSHQSLQQIFTASPTPMFISGRETSRLLAVNDAFERIFGYDHVDIIGCSEREVGFWAQANFETELRHRLQRNGRVDNVDVELRADDGDLRFALCSAIAIRLEETEVIVGTLNDITERKQLEHQLVHHAFHDGLTGLPNRLLFEDRVRHALSRGLRQGFAPAVLFLDLDDFKKVNDTLGHTAGDTLMRDAARRLSAMLRESDTCARVGGDEFALLLEDTTSLDEAMLVASRIRDALRPSFTVDGVEVSIDVSVGVSVARADSKAEDLLREADLAMYASKSAGRGCATAFEISMQDDMIRRYRLEADLRGAASRNELRLLFQPIVDIARGSVECVEALCRWDHPDFDLVSPAEFIPIAEQSGTILELGRWVLREACLARARLHLAGAPEELIISVNLSARQIASPDLLADVRAALEHASIPPETLMLEITETVLMEERQCILVDRLHQLKELGVRLAIDDFGTGYSSLAYLERLPVDVLKIDKSFTDRLGNGDDESEVARAVMALGKMVNLRTVVEGIETVEQRDRLKELGCEFGQGYLFSRPVKFDQLQRFIAERQVATAFLDMAAI